MYNCIQRSILGRRRFTYNNTLINLMNISINIFKKIQIRIFIPLFRCVESPLFRRADKQIRLASILSLNSNYLVERSQKKKKGISIDRLIYV